MRWARRSDSFGVGDVLVDPLLEIFAANGTKLAENDNWASNLAPVFSTVSAFAFTANSRDSALVATLQPGTYTAQIRGADGGTGRPSLRSTKYHSAARERGQAVAGFRGVVLGA